MFKGGDQPGFADHSRNRSGVREPIRRKDLDGDVTPQSRVVTAVDLAHAARAEQSDDGVRSEPSRLRGHAVSGCYHPSEAPLTPRVVESTRPPASRGRASRT